MGAQPDVLVVGGGIIGLTSAYFLAKSGLRVEVIDKGELGQEASWAGAGIIPPGNPDRAATPIDMLRAYSTSQFPAFSAELRELTGIDNGFLRCGGIEFLTPEEFYAEDVWQAEGIKFQRIQPSRTQRLEPRLVPPPDVRTCWLPGVAQVRNPWHVRAVIAACERMGVRLTPNAPADRWEWITAGCVVITAGAWSEALFHRLGARAGVAPVRGQIVLFRPDRPVLTHVITAGKRYLVPRGDGRVLAGSTEEPEAGFEKRNTPEGVRGLIDFACELVPALADAEIEKTWAGLRPGSPDGTPFIGPVPGHENVLAATGHFRAGIQLSIGTAEIVTRLVRCKPPPFPIDAFRLDREPDRTARPAFRS